MELQELSRCEQIVMAEIWRQGSVDLRTLLVHLLRKGNEWKPQTVSTFLVRLVNKGYLIPHRQGRNTVYEPAVACSLYADRLMEQYREFCRNAGYTPGQEGRDTARLPERRADHG